MHCAPCTSSVRRYNVSLSRLRLHEHLSIIYDTQVQQFAAALPYSRTSLERGEKCLYIVGEDPAAAVLDAGTGFGGPDFSEL
jgi:hypothetical protein